MLARATTRMIFAAQSANASGRTTVGCSGQAIRTKAGMSAGSTSSMVMVLWGDAVIWPSARVVMG
jgi:hypothetical protein